jgi:hypothetical protein
MIYLASLLHKKGNSPGLCKEGEFLVLLLSIGLDSHHIASWRFSLGFHHSAPWRLDSHHTVPWKLDAHGSLDSHHIALWRFSLDSHCLAPLEIWILIVVSVMYYGMVKPLPIMSGKAPSEPVMAS